LVPCLAIEAFQTPGALAHPGGIANRHLTDSGLLMPNLHRLSDYDNDNDNDNDNDCIRV
jgi:hypothetical protein